MEMKDEIIEQVDTDGIDRRGFLECMAWAGTGVLWTIAGGVLSSKRFAEAASDRAIVPDSHGGHHPPGRCGAVRYINRAAEIVKIGPCVLRTGRTRCGRRRWQTLSRALWQRHYGRRLVQLRPEGRSFHRPG